MAQYYSFEFYKDFVIKDLNNSIYFEDILTRDSYFATYPESKKITYPESDRIMFNYVTDRQSVVVDTNYLEICMCTYGCFYYLADRYYFNIINCEYVGENLSRVNFLIDPFVTDMCGTRPWTGMYNTQVVRQHISRSYYDNHIRELRHNDDVLSTGSMIYNVHQKLYEFTYQNEYYVMFQSSVDLTGGFSKFKDGNKPVVPASAGSTFNRITSPVNLYFMSQRDFTRFSKDLREYSWIINNFIKVTMMPQNFITAGTLVTVDGYDDKIYKLFTIADQSLSVNREIEDLAFTWEDIYKLYGLDMDTEKHLLRYPYCYAELTTWNGQSVEIRFEDVDHPEGLKFFMLISIGYSNSVAVYPLRYRSLGENSIAQFDMRGDFLNNAIILTTFDDVPVMVDNYNLGLAQHAYQRELTESRLISNRVNNVLTGNDTKDRIFDAVNLISNLSPLAIGEKITDEYEFYRQQEAEFNDSKLTKPTITAQTGYNNMQIKNGFYGLTLKFKGLPATRMGDIRRYHKRFGFSTPMITSRLYPNTMTKCNYFKVNLNNYQIPDTDTRFSDLLKIRLENGVTLWNNPVNTQDITNNDMREGM